MKISALTLAFALVSPAALAANQEWDYQLSGVSPASGTQRPTSGKNIAELNQSKDGSYEFRIRGNTAPSCYKSFRTTQVDKADGTLVITPEPLFGNCERIRLVVKLDGSGGVQQQLIGKKPNQSWQDEEVQGYGLTAR